MKMTKRILCFVIALFIILLMSACTNKAIVKPYRFNSSLKRNNIASVVAAQNDNYELKWDSETCLVSISDKQSGRVYSSIPTESSDDSEFGDSSDSILKMKSPIMIDCVRSETYEIKTGYAAECIENGDFSVSMIENGIRVTYIFDELKVSVPVKYLLFDDGIKIEVEPSKIAEDGNEYFLHTVAIAPFMCHSKNMTDDSYLFFPSGSGVIINMNSERDVSVNYISEIYGRDRMSDIPTWCDETNTADVKMPVFGSVRGDDGIFAIIDSGSEAGSICLDAYNKSIGYSSVYPEFAIRGETSVSNKFLSSSVNSIKYSDYYTLEPISVLYYPLSSENASYNKMADIYKDYLADKGMEKREKNDNALSLKILGGAMIDSSTLGMPKRKMFTTTSLNDAKGIVTDLTKSLSENINVDLVGYGKTGLQIGQICGGFTVAGSLGGKKALKSIYADMGKTGNNVFFDMDPVSIAKSGKGFSTSDVAVNTTRQRAGDNSYHLSTKNRNKFLCYYISRSLLSKTVEKSIKTLKNSGVKGVALDALTQYSYSDYNDQKYYSKGRMGKDVSNALSNYRKNGISVLSNSANVYAATESDLILDVPIYSSRMDFFGEEIPFYQMVMHGFVPMSSPSLNLSNNSREVLLKSAESGIGISYTVIKNFTGELRNEFDFYENTCYDDLKSSIADDYSRISELYSTVNKEEIVEHSIIGKGIHKTSFSNGIDVYTNFSDVKCDTPLGTLDSYSFIFGKEATQ